MKYPDGVRALPVGELIEKLRLVQDNGAAHEIAANTIGNLVIRDAMGGCLGYIDLGNGELDFWADGS